MGLLINGEWHTDWYDTATSGGEFIRQDAQFRNWIGPGGDYPAEADRYHLYVSLACPWAHRTLIIRAAKQLEAVIGVTVVKPEMLDKGWELPADNAGPLEDAAVLADIYRKAKPDYSGRVTVPVLWDKKTATIVNNESAEIIRMLNSAFDTFTEVKTDYYPVALQAEIDAQNTIIYDAINNGVYKAGFATDQHVYEKHVTRLFEVLETLDKQLGEQRYLVGDQITEADWRLFTTLIRFDAVYVGHFKCNLKRIEEFTHLPHYLRDLYQQPGVAATVDFEHIKTHYYYSHDMINPTRIVPTGPELDYNRAHNRAQLFGA
ncbi:glutathione S-transferase family protein [Neptunomonas sp. XY-337]|uniref:glutathione S-transferase family protein n=1 Tax=Neptunomonas sp. XY-337 TaxID=2561897 RepID=UPI0010A9F5AC|nr:glutathione S-transferase family protein [Neptunomonas sp. XY-337]